MLRGQAKTYMSSNGGTRQARNKRLDVLQILDAKESHHAPSVACGRTMDQSAARRLYSGLLLHVGYELVSGSQL